MLLIGPSQVAVAAATYTVNTTDDLDDGTCDVTHCSLREAIDDANASAGADEIHFAISGVGPHTIQLASALPTITEGVVIDGYTQAGASPNTVPAPGGLNSVLMIELDGTNAGLTVSGLEVVGGNTTIRGLIINRFDGSGIRLVTSSDNVVTGNFIGTDVSGLIDLGNDFSGVRIGGSSGQNQIGGTAPADRNLISANELGGVFISSSGDNVVQGNLIGTDKTASGALGNTGAASVWITTSASDNTIGGTEAGAGNVIANGKSNAVGVMVFNGSGNAILGNSIFNHARLGIDLEGTSQGVTANDDGDGDAGANGVQNFPVLSGVRSDMGFVTGTLNSIANSDFRVEFFANSVCDGSGHGEGATFVGAGDVSTDGSGDAAFEVVLGTPSPGAAYLTATATDSANNTSEFSACRGLNGQPIARDVSAAITSGTSSVWSPDIDDPDGGALTCVISKQPSSGSANVASDCSGGTFTPGAGTGAVASFAYRVTDGLDSDTGSVTMERRATVGLVDPTQGHWYLRNSVGVVTSFFYGNPGDLPISGDWDGDGIATPGLYRQSDGFFYARNTNTQGPADAECFAGNPADIPIAGDWDGDGDDNLGIYRPSEQVFYLFTTTCTGSPMGAAQISFLFGNPGDKPVAGDWDGDGIDEIGLHRESTGFFYWRNTLDTGVASDAIFFGNPADRFVSGDWGIVDGTDTPAIFRPSDISFYFRHTLTQGNADSQFTWEGAKSGWVPIAGEFGLG
jgi:CSLREA domain-containing protein